MSEKPHPAGLPINSIATRSARTLGAVVTCHRITSLPLATTFLGKQWQLRPRKNLPRISRQLRVSPLSGSADQFSRDYLNGNNSEHKLFLFKANDYLLVSCLGSLIPEHTQDFSPLQNLSNDIFSITGKNNYLRQTPSEHLYNKDALDTDDQDQTPC